MILSKWLKSGYIYERKLFPSTSGTPQGGIISPTMLNITLDGIEKEIQRLFSKNTKKGKAAKINFIR
jgi:RNA-directed DNA polymerase